MTEDLARLVRRYFVALDGHDNGDVPLSDVRALEIQLRNAVFTPEARIEDAMREVGRQFRPDPAWQARVRAEIARQELDRPGRLRRAWRWLRR